MSSYTDTENEPEHPRSRKSGKLCLLISKNVSVLLAHPLGVAVIMMAPILLFLYTQFDLLINARSPHSVDQIKYAPLSLIKPNTTTIFYSPINNVLGRIVNEVAANLGMKGIEAYLYASEMDAALKTKNGFVGIEFEDKLRTIIKIPSEVKVALRFPCNLLKKNVHLWSQRIFKPLGSELNEKSAYELNGFLSIQSKLSDALIREKSQDAYIPQVNLQSFPDKEQYIYTYLIAFYNNLIGFFMFIFMGPSVIIGQQIVSEKQRQLREIMRIMGLPLGLNWISWFIVTFIFFAIPTLIIIIVMKWFLCPSSNIAVLVLIFIVYLVSIIWLTFMVITFVNSTIMAMSTVTLAHCLSFLPFLIVGAKPGGIQAPVICMFTNSAMSLIFNQILGYELRGVGSQWENLFQRSHPDDQLSIGYILLIMLTVDIFYVVCCLYADQLNPGEFGLAKKWYFPLQRKFWCSWDRPRAFADEEWNVDNRMGSVSNLEAFERVSHNNRVIMEAQNLTKKFGDLYAVRDLNLRFYEDEITVLLGQNGAGKTTAFMMLAGIISPTSGRVLINGYDMASSTQKARKSLSICPQQNILFEELSAYWHLVFYSRLKGFYRSEAKEEAIRYLELMDLMDKSTIKVEYLTTGMRRKLSVCCALCANTKVVLFDEPTACLDPSARREVWNLLRYEKSGRCIVMNTHFMEAAEVLGDRIAIMSHAQMHGYGTAEFLVNNLGPGYCLVCVRLKDCNVNDVTNFLSSRIDDIEVERISETEIFYRLPNKHVKQFTRLFRSLENRMETLRLSSFGVSAPTLGETFVKISGDYQDKHTSTGSSMASAWVPNLGDSEELRKSKRCYNDWHGMMMKKILYTRHHPFLLGVVILLPLCAMGLMLLLGLLRKHSVHEEINPIDLSKYPGAKIFKRWKVSDDSDSEIFADNSKEISERYGQIAIDAGAKVRTITKMGLEDFVLNNLNLDIEGFDETFVAAATFQDGSIIAWFNQRMNHGQSLSMGLVYKAIGQTLVDIDIVVTNKPRISSSSSEFENVLTPTKLSLFILMYMCFTLSTFVLLPIVERSSQMKHQQLMSGIGVWTYWLSHLIWDFGLLLLVIMALVTSIHSEHIKVVYTMAILLPIFCISALPFTYLFSFVFKDPGNGMSCVLVINCCIVMLAVGLYSIRSHYLFICFHYILMMLPFYSMYSATINVFEFGRRKCPCKDPHIETIEFQTCWEHDMHIDIPIVFMVLSAILFFGLLLLSSRLLPIRYAIKRHYERCEILDENDDLKKTRKQVDDIIEDREQLKASSVVCNRITKKYRRLLAVHCVSLKVNPYECFGLLGLNGAGKSSTIGMIVGSHVLTQGDIYVQGYSIKNQMKKCYQHIGFCPQTSTALAYMTGRQMLKFACLTNGIKKKDIPIVISNLADSFMFTQHLNLRTKHYSLGTKRKLNIAMAVFARTLLCLDEPTTGVDLTARQGIWLVISGMRTIGKSVLLTSHNMQECEALCSNAAIMVNGTLRCIGSVPQLKSRYKKGVFIKIQLALDSEIRNLRLN